MAYHGLQNLKSLTDQKENNAKEKFFEITKNTWAATSDLKCLQNKKNVDFLRKNKNIQKGPIIDFLPHQSI